MNRPWQIWMVFAGCVGVLMAALAWISAEVLRLDHAQAEAHRRAAFEEDVRLALWRMDSALAPIVAAESARPYFAYTAFYPAERAYTRMFAEIDRGEVLMPSPLLAQTPPFTKLHFQIGPTGAMTSPQAPKGNMLDLAEGQFCATEQVERAAELVAQLQEKVTGSALAPLLPPLDARPIPAVHVRLGFPDDVVANSPPAATNSPANLAGNRGDSRARGESEWAARNAYVQRETWQQQQLANDAQAAPADVNAGVFRAVWIAGELVLARKVSIDNRDYVQGCWLDWPAIRADLRGRIVDLLPDADVAPESAVVSDDQRERMLTALPVRLLPGTMPALAAAASAPLTAAEAVGWGTSLTPAQLMLSVAWAGVVLAAFAVGILVRGIVALSERRGAFVSAVTHEMRTPLTTFQMYTDMLAEGMVEDETKRQKYLGTLRREAGRLAHLVENVLAYARLEHNGHGVATEAVALGDLLDASRERLRDVAQRAGFEVAFDVPAEVATATLDINRSAVERIWLNLVDNAGKYSQSAPLRRIDISARRSGQHSVTVIVRDHGPGIPRSRVKHLFRPFNKSAHEAAHTAPGVGLGLTLCRRLARHMGGDLCYAPAPAGPGAAFHLVLPLA